MMTAMRVAAFAIAFLAVLDPAVTMPRVTRPLVAVVSAESATNQSLMARVTRELGRAFTVIQGPSDAASGTVLVGNALPDESGALARPVLAVKPSVSTPSIRLLSIDAPPVSPLNARIPVQVRAEISGAGRRPLSFELRSGDVVVSRQSTTAFADPVDLDLILWHTPTATGASSLEAVVFLDPTQIGDSATTVVDVRDERFDVLFYDARASWLSTFVRRALERDPRFTVTSRVVTSRGMANTAGQSPVTLRDARALRDFATIVVGAPEALTEADVAGLEEFMRRRGGRVALLYDQRVAGRIDRLTGAGGWRAVRLPSATSFGPLRAQEVAWPATLPSGGTQHVYMIGRDSSVRAIVWSAPVGAGRVLVNGALDSWHYRDDASSFDEFWTNTIAELSATAPDPIALTLSPRAVTPGTRVRIEAKVRDTFLSSREQRTSTLSAALVGADDSTMVRLWPSTSPGTFIGSVVAPRRSGVYRLIVSTDAERAEAPIVVDPTTSTVTLDDSAAIEAFVSSGGGSVVPESQLRELRSRLASALPTVSRVETWHPMRSVWWILPFALFLGGEWWWRRRRGLA